MDDVVKDLAQKLLNTGFSELSKREQRVIQRIAKRVHISRNINREIDDNRTIGERLADNVASFGGSWTFIMCFGVFLGVWTLINSEILGAGAFDPYPYIFLNLLLSMVAALQAPVIMMSQNRQGEKDRLMAAHDYEVNLKAELEILSLHDKLDSVRTDQLTTLLASQQQQLALLSKFVTSNKV